MRKKTDPKLEFLGWCFLAFLIELLVGGRPRFCLAYLLLGQAVEGRAIMGSDHRSLSHRGQAIIGVTSIKSKVALEEERTIG